MSAEVLTTLAILKHGYPNNIAVVKEKFQSLEAKIKDEVLPVAIKVTNGVKAVLDADSNDLIGSVAGQFGKDLEDKLRSVIGQIVVELPIAQQFLELGDKNLILAEVLKLVKDSKTQHQILFWAGFEALVAEKLADGELTIQESIELGQYYYHNHPE